MTFRAFPGGQRVLCSSVDQQPPAVHEIVLHVTFNHGRLPRPCGLRRTGAMNQRPQAPALPPHAAPSEAIGIVMVCFGWFIFASLSLLSSWRPGNAPAITDNAIGGGLASQLILGAMALLLLWGRGYPLHSLYPKPSWRGVLEGAALFIGAALVCKSALLLLPEYPTPVDDMLAANQASWPVIVLSVVVNSVYIEVFLLGYLMRGLRRYGASIALGIPLLVRMLDQLYQGPVWVVAVILDGMLFALYFRRRGELFPVVLAQAAISLTTFVWPKM